METERSLRDSIINSKTSTTHVTVTLLYKGPQIESQRLILFRSESHVGICLSRVRCMNCIKTHNAEVCLPVLMFDIRN
jgi:hypothetical protein